MDQLPVKRLATPLSRISLPQSPRPDLDPPLKAYLAPLLTLKGYGTVRLISRPAGGKERYPVRPNCKRTQPELSVEKNGNSIPGATSKDLIITDLNATTDSGNYKVVVSNDFGSFSKQITLNVFSPTAVKMVVGDHHSLYLDAMGFPYGLGNNHMGRLDLL